MDNISLDHQRESFNTLIVKAPNSNTLNSGTKTLEELSNDNIDNDKEEEKKEEEEEEESLITLSPDVLQFLRPKRLEKIIRILFNNFNW